jgi:hypothetical protein
MAQINGISGMTPGEIAFELNRGGKFVVYRYCYSAVVVTMTQNTDIYFVRAEKSRIMKGLPWTLLTLCVGWWAFPWGPIRLRRLRLLPTVAEGNQFHRSASQLARNPDYTRIRLGRYRR